MIYNKHTCSLKQVFLTMLLKDFNDPIYNKRNNRKAVWLNRYIVNQLNEFAVKNDKSPEEVAEYLLQVGINTKDQEANITFDVKSI
jgi:hypothetical protein|tara:strand:+ start:362 stop:619 length:258 start_codon:yes stop_codon:yes gene_type:complete